MGAEEFLPDPPTDIDALRAASAGCRGCGLFADATQTVFGEGDPHSRVVLVGEQPGDREDLDGHPFVGPAGRLLDTALGEVGIDRDEVYVTNVVKHFKWEPRGKARLHKKPSAREIAACSPWLEAELRTIAPAMVVCLGATAAQALLGRDFRVTRQRGRVLRGSGTSAYLATVHPSSILRAPGPSERERARQEFVDDLRVVEKYLGR